MEPSLVTGKFKTQAGTQLFFRRWTPLPRSEGTIVLVHGLGEHSGRYVHVGDFFSRAGFSVFAFDLRGHGSSDGKPVVIIRYQDYLADLEAVMTYLNRPDPLILFGHSLGGQIVLAYGQSTKKPPSGYIVASPWLRLSYPPPIWLESLARALNVVCPAWRIPNRIGSGDTSRDQALLDSFPDLDKTYQFITVRTYFEVIKMGRKLMAHPAMDAPVLLTHGEADPVTSIDATREFFERLVAPNKTFISYPEGRHELHNDLIRAGVLRDYLNWIVRRALRA
jgi:alpha-beta hydrolase superfamily lysophospholipase